MRTAKLPNDIYRSRTRHLDALGVSLDKRAGVGQATVLALPASDKRGIGGASREARPYSTVSIASAFRSRTFSRKRTSGQAYISMLSPLSGRRAISRH